MNRSNNHLNCSSFTEKIDQYIKMVDWKEDDQTIERLCIDISKNMNIIESDVGFSTGREKFAALAKRIKAEFPEHEKAQELAGVMSCYVNDVFFKTDDVVKLIFSYLTPVNTEHLYKPVSGLRDLDLVSKSFGKQSKEVKNQWVQDEFVSLKIYGLKNADDAVKYIKENNLKKINLKDFPDFNETHLKEIAGLKIQSLSINCKGIKEWPEMHSLTHIIPKNATDKDLTKLAKACPNLTTIDLTGARVADIGVTELAKACPNLTTIELTGTGVTDIGVIKIAKACPNLTKINLPGNWVTDICLEALAKACPNLTAINLGGTGITDGGVKAIAKACPNLTTIDLSCTNVTDGSIRKLAKKCPNLTHINLYNTEITGLGLEKLEKIWPNLKFIDLCGTCVTDFGLSWLAKACPNLTTIRLKDTQVTNAGVEMLAKACSNLTTIDLINSNVAYFGVVAIAEACPNLATINISKAQLGDFNVAELKKAYTGLEISFYSK